MNLFLHNSQYTDSVSVSCTCLPPRYEHERIAKFHEAHPFAHIQREFESLVMFLQYIVFGRFVVNERKAASVQMHLAGHARITCHYYNWTTRPESWHNFSSPKRQSKTKLLFQKMRCKKFSLISSHFLWEIRIRNLHITWKLFWLDSL